MKSKEEYILSKIDNVRIDKLSGVYDGNISIIYTNIKEDITFIYYKLNNHNYLTFNSLIVFQVLRDTYKLQDIEMRIFLKNIFEKYFNLSNIIIVISKK